MNRQAAAPVSPKRQTTQFSCVAASLSTALESLGVMECGEHQVNKVLGALPLQGASWEQCAAAANHYGCRTTLVVPATIPMIKGWTDAGSPVLIGWNPEGRDWSHASLVFDVDDQFVYVADSNIPDPSQTVRKVTHQEFYGKWYEKYNGYMVRRPAMRVEREITDDGRQVMASQKVSKQLDFIYTVSDPSESSEWIDCIYKSPADKFHQIAIGYGNDWKAQHVAIHDDFSSASKDLTDRLNKLWGGAKNVPDWVFRNGGPQTRMGALARVSSEYRIYQVLQDTVLTASATAVGYRHKLARGTFIAVGSQDVQVFSPEELDWFPLEWVRNLKVVPYAPTIVKLTDEARALSEAEFRKLVLPLHDLSEIPRGSEGQVVNMPRRGLVQRVATQHHAAKKPQPVQEPAKGKVEKVPPARNPYARQPQTGAGEHHTRNRDVAKGRASPKHKGWDLDKEAHLRSNLVRLARENPKFRPHLLPLLKQARGYLKSPWSAMIKDSTFEGFVSKIRSCYPYGSKVAGVQMWASVLSNAWVHKSDVAMQILKFAHANHIVLDEKSALNAFDLGAVASWSHGNNQQDALYALGSLLYLGGEALARKFEPYIEEFAPVKKKPVSPTVTFMSWLTTDIQNWAKQVWSELHDKKAAIDFAGALCEDVNWHESPLPTVNDPPDTKTSYTDVAQHLQWSLGEAAAFSYALLILAGATSAANAVKRTMVSQIA